MTLAEAIDEPAILLASKRLDPIMRCQDTEVQHLQARVLAISCPMAGARRRSNAVVIGLLFCLRAMKTGRGKGNETAGAGCQHVKMCLRAMETGRGSSNTRPWRAIPSHQANTYGALRLVIVMPTTRKRAVVGRSVVINSSAPLAFAAAM
jgi:hypothetical protein